MIYDADTEDLPGPWSLFSRLIAAGFRAGEAGTVATNTTATTSDHPPLIGGSTATSSSARQGTLWMSPWSISPLIPV
jgi:hypothetical protein